jgi:ankyrin repeat protein
LLAAGVSQRIADGQGRTAVDAASFAGKTKIVRVLVESGSPVSDILVAATAGNADLVSRFLREDRFSCLASDFFGRTSLHRAVMDGHIDVATRLLASGLDPNIADNEGLTPLHLAATSGRVDACRLLLGCNARVDVAVPGPGVQPIHLAAANGKLGVIRLLVDNGADVDALDAHFRTPLHMAAEHGHLAVVEWLVNRRATINAANADHYTPRMLALEEGHKAVAAFLLEHGAEKSALED